MRRILSGAVFWLARRPDAGPSVVVLVSDTFFSGPWRPCSFDECGLRCLFGDLGQILTLRSRSRTPPPGRAWSARTTALNRLERPAIPPWEPHQLARRGRHPLGSVS